MLEPIFADDKNRYTRYRPHRLRLGLLAAWPISMRTGGRGRQSGQRVANELLPEEFRHES